MLVVAVIQKSFGVEVVGIEVARVVVVELHVSLVCPSIVEILVVVRLSEGVLVPQFLVRLGIVEDGSGREFPRGVVVVEFDVESLRSIYLPHSIILGVERHRFGVFAPLVRHAVVGAAIMQNVRVVALRAHGVGGNIPVEKAVVALFRTDFLLKASL